LFTGRREDGKFCGWRADGGVSARIRSIHEPSRLPVFLFIGKSRGERGGGFGFCERGGGCVSLEESLALAG